MIGPQAWENIYLGPRARRLKDFVIEHEGTRYIYHTWSYDWELFETHEKFKAWAMAVVQNNDGGYADKKEKVNA